MIKYTKHIVLLIAFSALFIEQSRAQCPTGEVELKLYIETDGYGYEGYWSLVNGLTGCGNNQIASGGNTAVSCTGGGAKNQTPGGYGNNLTFLAGTWCVDQDSAYTLHYVDDWGDGGFGFTVTVNGYEVLAVDGQGASQSWSFNASEPPAIDAGLDHLKTPYSYSAAGNTNLIATVKNQGKDTITSLVVNYALDGGAAQTATLSGLSIPYGEHFEFTHPSSFNIANGMHSIKVWTGNVNGMTDPIPQNDTLDFAFEVGPGIPNIIDDYLFIAPIQTEIN